MGSSLVHQFLIIYYYINFSQRLISIVRHRFRLGLHSRTTDHIGLESNSIGYRPYQEVSELSRHGMGSDRVTLTGRVLLLYSNMRNNINSNHPTLPQYFLFPVSAIKVFGRFWQFPQSKMARE
ncbi:MAG: hypothetical protein ACI81T_004138 [Bacteroidia bacterium]